MVVTEIIEESISSNPTISSILAVALLCLFPVIPIFEIVLRRYVLRRRRDISLQTFRKHYNEYCLRYNFGLCFLYIFISFLTCFNQISVIYQSDFKVSYDLNYYTQIRNQQTEYYRILLSAISESSLGIISFDSRRRLSDLATINSQNSLSIVYHDRAYNNLLTTDLLRNLCYIESNITSQTECFSNALHYTIFSEFIKNGDYDSNYDCDGVYYDKYLLGLDGNEVYFEDNIDYRHPNSSILISYIYSSNCTRSEIQQLLSQISSYGYGSSIPIDINIVQSELNHQEFSDSFKNYFVYSFIVGMIIITISVIGTRGIICVLATVYGLLVSMIMAIGVLPDMHYAYFSVYNIIGLYAIILIGALSLLILASAWYYVFQQPHNDTITLEKYYEILSLINPPFLFLTAITAFLSFIVLLSTNLALQQFGLFLGVAAIVYMSVYYNFIVAVWIRCSLRHLPISNKNRLYIFNNSNQSYYADSNRASTEFMEQERQAIIDSIQSGSSRTTFTQLRRVESLDAMINSRSSMPSSHVYDYNQLFDDDFSSNNRNNQNNNNNNNDVPSLTNRDSDVNPDSDVNRHRDPRNNPLASGNVIPMNRRPSVAENQNSRSNSPVRTCVDENQNSGRESEVKESESETHRVTTIDYFYENHEDSSDHRPDRFGMSIVSRDIDIGLPEQTDSNNSNDMDQGRQISDNATNNIQVLSVSVEPCKIFLKTNSLHHWKTLADIQQFISTKINLSLIKHPSILQVIGAIMLVFVLLAILLTAFLGLNKQIDIDYSIPVVFSLNTNIGQICHIQKHYKSSLFEPYALSFQTNGTDAGYGSTVSRKLLGNQPTTLPSLEPSISPSYQPSAIPSQSPNNSPISISTTYPTIQPTSNDLRYPNQPITFYRIENLWGVKHDHQYVDTTATASWNVDQFVQYTNMGGPFEDLKNLCDFVENNRDELNVNPNWIESQDCISNQLTIANETLKSLSNSTIEEISYQYWGIHAYDPSFIETYWNCLVLLYWAYLFSSPTFLGVDYYSTFTYDTVLMPVWIRTNFSVQNFMSNIDQRDTNLINSMIENWQYATTSSSNVAIKMSIPILITSGTFSLPLFAQDMSYSFSILSLVGFLGVIIVIFIATRNVSLTLLLTFAIFGIVVFTIISKLSAFSATFDLIDLISLMSIYGIFTITPILFVNYFLVETEYLALSKVLPMFIYEGKNIFQNQELVKTIVKCIQYTTISMFLSTVVIVTCGMYFTFYQDIFITQKFGQYLIIAPSISFLFTNFVLPGWLMLTYRIKSFDSIEFPTLRFWPFLQNEQDSRYLNFQPSEDDIETLVGLGYSRYESQLALMVTENSIDRAVQILHDWRMTLIEQELENNNGSNNEDVVNSNDDPSQQTNHEPNQNQSVAEHTSILDSSTRPENLDRYDQEDVENQDVVTEEEKNNSNFIPSEILSVNDTIYSQNGNISNHIPLGKLSKYELSFKSEDEKKEVSTSSNESGEQILHSHRNIYKSIQMNQIDDSALDANTNVNIADSDSKREEKDEESNTFDEIPSPAPSVII